MSKISKRALISVYYKEGIEEIGKLLSENGWEIISTGGTSEYLKKHDIPVIPVSSITDFPEILNGRVKTLHPAVFGPILSRKKREHLEQLSRHGLKKIDLVIVNFYPFEEYLVRGTEDLDSMIEKIDIGGPSMVRAAAKNFSDTTVIVDQNDYISVVKNILKNNGLKDDENLKLATKAFSYTAYYDSLISEYLSNNNKLSGKYITVAGRKNRDLRYGENPHQKSSLFITDPLSPLLQLEQLNGKELSFNNILDMSMVYELLNEFTEYSDSFSVIVKHQNPCGAALDRNITESFRKALSGDPISAFGGIVGFSKPLDKETALELKKIFFEVIIAPGFSEDSLKILKKKKNLRLIRIQPGYREKYDIKTVPGGIVIQERDNLALGTSDFRVIAGDTPSESEMKDISFGWKLIKFVKSNGIVIVKDRKLIGVGAGQMSRIDSVEIAIKKSNFPLKNSVLLSDAFFPFKDSIDMAAKYQISIVVEPGGSIRDEEVIEAAKRKNIKLIFTGKRHFRH